jgi:hypothetical protein
MLWITASIFPHNGRHFSAAVAIDSSEFVTNGQVCDRRRMRAGGNSAKPFQRFIPFIP